MHHPKISRGRPNRRMIAASIPCLTSRPLWQVIGKHSDRNGEPWFVAKDVCAILELSNPRDAVASLEDDEKGVAITDTLGGTQEMSIISESGLYALIFRSRKPEARKFRRWITQDVLPQIRRNGAYTLTTSFTTPPTPVEHPAVQFITILNAVRARGANTEKILYSIGNLFQSSLAGAYQSNRQVLPMILPPPPDPATLPPPTSRGGHKSHAPSAAAQNGEKILAVLREQGPLPYGAILKAAGLAGNTMRNAMRRLTDHNLITQDANKLWKINETQP